MASSGELEKWGSWRVKTWVKEKQDAVNAVDFDSRVVDDDAFKPKLVVKSPLYRHFKPIVIVPPNSNSLCGVYGIILCKSRHYHVLWNTTKTSRLPVTKHVICWYLLGKRSGVSMIILPALLIVGGISRSRSHEHV